MKLLAAFIIALFTLSITYGQQPSLPGISKVFADIKANKYVYDKLKKDYKIANPQACKFEMKMIIGGGDIITSDWSTYKSDEGKKLNYYWPDDRAYTVFIVTTPESTEGVTYKLPLVVEYSRIVNSTLQNSWSYYWWYFDTPYSATGGKEDTQFQQLLIQQLSKITGKADPNTEEAPMSLEWVTSIETIEKSDKADLREMSYSNADYVTRVFKVSCSSIEYNDYEQASTKTFYPHSAAYVKARFARDKENGKVGNWYFESFYGGFDTYLERGEPNEDKTLYATIGDVGFKAIYQRPPVQKKIPFSSDLYEEMFNANVSKALYDFAMGVAGSEAELQKYLDPNQPELMEGFRQYFQEFKDKCVYIGYSEANKTDAVKADLSASSSSPEQSKVYLTIRAERPSVNAEKSLKATYKAAGMSKAAMARFNGRHLGNENLVLKMVLIDGELFIAEAPVHPEPIPF